ncbi:MAG: DUF2977 domain-containing protein [Cetobacterium sp.]|nr:DUF2977 domain-containing protein [Cetobacterium sp.]
MKILLNKYNYIIAYCAIGEIKDALEIELQEDFKIEEHNLLDYQYISEKLVYNPIPKIKPEGVKIEYDGNIWIETASLEEQKDYYLKKSLEIGKKLEEYKNIGLQGGQRYIDLLKELEVNKNKYIELCQTEAIKIDEHMQSTKPIK